jgi:hypothetical protein
MSDRHHSHRELTGSSKWRLLCLNVDVDSPDLELSPYLGEGVDPSEVRAWLNRSPLFIDSPLSDTETVVAFWALQHWLYPRFEGTLNHPWPIDEASLNRIPKRHCEMEEG